MIPRRPATMLATALLGAALQVTAPGASAQIWRCESNGVSEYTNQPPSGRDASCRPVDLPVITTIPAPPVPVAPPPVSTPSQPPASGAAGTPRSPAPAAVAPGTFPRVDPASQRLRDQDRRRILGDELRREEARLAELRAEFNGGEPERRGDERNYQKYLDRVQRLKDDIARSESALASLKREMAALRD